VTGSTYEVTDPVRRVLRMSGKSVDERKEEALYFLSQFREAVHKKSVLVQRRLTELAELLTAMEGRGRLRKLFNYFSRRRLEAERTRAENRKRALDAWDKRVPALTKLIEGGDLARAVEGLKNLGLDIRFSYAMGGRYHVLYPPQEEELIYNVVLVLGGDYFAT